MSISSRTPMTIEKSNRITATASLQCSSAQVVCVGSFRWFSIDWEGVGIPRTDVAALNGGLGGTETQTDVLVPSATTLARTSALRLDLGVLEDVRLLLESTLRLDGQLGRPTTLGQHFGSAVLLDEAALTDITRTLMRDWFYRRALHTGGWQVSVSPTLVEPSVATPGPCEG